MTDSAAIRENIEIIEEAYEYMLAYAAQGRAEEGAGPDGAHIRTFIERFLKAAEGLRLQAADMRKADGATGAGFYDGFQRDGDTVQSVLGLLLTRSNISSEIVDNANGLIAMRSYLTGVFFLDKALL